MPTLAGNPDITLYLTLNLTLACTPAIKHQAEGKRR